MKNNKGFFLAETIVVLALVTTVMAFVYPNVSKLYDNYYTRITYYDQPEDLLLLRELSNTYMSDIENKTKGTCGDIHNFVGAKKYENGPIKNGANATDLSMQLGDLDKVYLTSYMSTPSSDDYDFNRYLKRMRKVTNDVVAYRLIGVFKVSGEHDRYASIKITTSTYCNYK